VYFSQQQFRCYPLNSNPWDHNSRGDGCPLLQLIYEFYSHSPRRLKYVLMYQPLVSRSTIFLFDLTKSREIIL